MSPPPQDPAQEKRVLLAVALSIGVLWFFQTFVFEPPPPLPVSDETGVLGAEAGQPGLPAEAAGEGVGTAAPALPVGDDGSASAEKTEGQQASLPALPPIEPQTLRRNWGVPEGGRAFDEGVKSRWSNFGGSPVGFRIGAYQEPYDVDWLPTWLLKGVTSGLSFGDFDIGWPEAPETGAVELVRGDETEVLLPVGVDATGIEGDGGYYRVSEGPGRLTFVTRRGGFEVTKSFEIPEVGYVLGYEVTFRNVTSQPLTLQPSYGVADYMVEGADRFGPQPETWAEIGEDVENYVSTKLDKKPREFEGEVSWFGVGDRYFMVGLEPESREQGSLVMTKVAGEDRYATVFSAPHQSLAPNQSHTQQFKLFAGPKALDLLEDSGLRMATAVNFGMFGIVALPILSFLQFLFGLIGNWGLSIIALTVVIKAALFPLSQKAYRSMEGMKKLQPEINTLKEKHGDDKEAMNREMMELWKEHGVNPMGGCLPMVIQMPIWFALYRVLWNSVELYQTPFLYFCDLSLRDPIGIFPLLLGVTMWLQQKMAPTASADPTQQKIMQMMPLIFAFMMFALPAGLVVYILVNTVLSIIQQWLIRRGADQSGDGPEQASKTSPPGKGGGGKKATGGGHPARGSKGGAAARSASERKRK